MASGKLDKNPTRHVLQEVTSVALGLKPVFLPQKSFAALMWSRPNTKSGGETDFTIDPSKRNAYKEHVSHNQQVDPQQICLNDFVVR